MKYYWIYLCCCFFQVEGNIKSFQDFIKSTNTNFDLISDQLQKLGSDLLTLSSKISCIETTLEEHDRLIRQHGISLEGHENMFIKIKTKHVEYDEKLNKIETDQNNLGNEQCRIDKTQAEHTIQINAIQRDIDVGMYLQVLKSVFGPETVCKGFY